MAGRSEAEPDRAADRTADSADQATGSVDRAAGRDTADAHLGASPDVPPDETPDVLLDVPALHVDKIDLEVEDLRARVELHAEVLDLLKLNVGADVALGSVKLDIEGVDAQAILKVRLQNVAAILARVLATIDHNPQILEQLTSAAGTAVRDVGAGARDAAGELGRGAGGAVQEIGSGAGEAVESVGSGAGEAVESVGSGAGDAAEEVGAGAGKAVTDAEVGEAVSGAASVTTAADRGRRTDRSDAGRDASDSGGRPTARGSTRAPRASPRARQRSEARRARRQRLS
jgi:hypothetical protein